MVEAVKYSYCIAAGTVVEGAYCNTDGKVVEDALDEYCNVGQGSTKQTMEVEPSGAESMELLASSSGAVGNMLECGFVGTTMRPSSILGKLESISCWTSSACVTISSSSCSSFSSCSNKEWDRWKWMTMHHQKK